MDIIREKVEKKYMKKRIIDLRPGDTVRVNYRIKEGDRERIQSFEGVVISLRGSGVNATFTVRKISYGVGVERIFPVHSPLIESIKIISRGRVRRGKLYYLRERVGKKARLKAIRSADIKKEKVYLEEDKTVERETQVQEKENNKNNSDNSDE